MELIGYALPVITGFGSVTENSAGSIQNNGWEFTLNTQNIISKDFRWTTSIDNLTLPQNKLLAYPDLQNSSYNTTFAVGHSVYSQFVYNYLGLNQQAGIYTFATQNANGFPSYPNDLIISRPVAQSAYGGMSNSFSYKGFQLDIMLQFVKQLGYNYLHTLGIPGTIGNQPVYVLNAWTNPQSITGTQKYTQDYSGEAAQAYEYIGPSDASISDASFIRFKNVALSYTLPGRWVKKMTLSNAKIYFQAQNLFTITSYKGLDPENQGAMPPLRMITFGIQAGF